MPRRILSDDEVRVIRTDWATRVTRRSLARRYGCSEALIKRVIGDQNYRSGEREEREGVTDEEFMRLVSHGT